MIMVLRLRPQILSLSHQIKKNLTKTISIVVWKQIEWRTSVVEFPAFSTLMASEFWIETDYLGSLHKRYTNQTKAQPSESLWPVNKRRPGMNSDSFALDLRPLVTITVFMQPGEKRTVSCCMVRFLTAAFQNQVVNQKI